MYLSVQIYLFRLSWSRWAALSVNDKKKRKEKEKKKKGKEKRGKEKGFLTRISSFNIYYLQINIPIPSDIKSNKIQVLQSMSELYWYMAYWIY